jgi:hypothetical protein
VKGDPGGTSALPRADERARGVDEDEDLLFDKDHPCQASLSKGTGLVKTGGIPRLVGACRVDLPVADGLTGVWETEAGPVLGPWPWIVRITWPPVLHQ